jgi:hypothetical protein
LPNGGFSTWLYPDNETPANNTEDLEVIGTFGLYLTKIATDKYFTTLTKIAEFLKQRQNNDGTWNETWYFSQYYGIYRIASFLAIFNRTKYYIELEKSLNEIKTTIKDDGAWGRENKSNSLDTAFCISFLINYPSSINSQFIKNGISYLLNHQNITGSWENVSFFSEYPKGSIGYEQYIYESELYTTSIVLETLLDYIIYLDNSSSPLFQNITFFPISFYLYVLIIVRSPECSKKLIRMKS